MKLDLRRPTIVILGAWNPSIFSPGWCAHHLFEYPIGQNVQVSTLMDVQSQTTINYIDNIGINTTNTRLCLYCNEWKEDVIAHVEKICANLLKTLPHTPLGDFGVNFLFIDEDPEQEVFDLLESADNINAHGEVIAKELSAFLKIDDKIMLRFLRRLADGHVVFDFNYNFNIVSKEDFAALNQKLVNRLFTKSENLIRDLYGISGYQVVQHKFTGNTEEKIKSDD